MIGKQQNYSINYKKIYWKWHIKENWSNSSIIHEYNRLIASLAPENYVSFRWKSVAGTIDIEERNWILNRYNVSRDEAEWLEKKISDQHKKGDLQRFLP